MGGCDWPTVPDKDISGDNLYAPTVCDQVFVDWVWPAYKFNNAFWGGGFGYDDVCNNDLPACRTLSALWLLNYSAENYQDEEYSGACLNWGCRYVRDQARDLRAACGDGSAIAASFGGRIELYLGCFYSKDVPGRAETFMHESRHEGGLGHDADFPSWSAFGSGGGADSTWAYEGAWMYGALYLWWFWAAGVRTTQAMKDAARIRAQFVIDNAFATHPGFVI